MPALEAHSALKAPDQLLGCVMPAGCACFRNVPTRMLRPRGLQWVSTRPLTIVKAHAMRSMPPERLRLHHHALVVQVLCPFVSTGSLAFCRVVVCSCRLQADLIVFCEILGRIMAVAIVSDRQLALLRNQVSKTANKRCSASNVTCSPCNSLESNIQRRSDDPSAKRRCHYYRAANRQFLWLANHAVTGSGANAPQIAHDREGASRGKSAADAKAAIRRANDEKAAQWAAAVLADRAEKAHQRQQKLAELEALRVQVSKLRILKSVYASPRLVKFTRL